MSFDTPIADTGRPRASFEGEPVTVQLADGRQSQVAPRVIVQGSSDEAAFRDEQRRTQAQLDAQTAQQKLDEARREADRIRRETEVEAERRRLELARETEQKQLGLAREADRLRAERAAQEAAEQARREQAEQEAARRQQTAQQASLLGELPPRTELNVRLRAH